jgi:gliding motility-associated-like protein
MIDTYTLTVTDNVNTCTSNTVVTIYQNIRPPKALISLSRPALTCAVYSVNLTNSSSTGVLPGSFFSPLGIGAKLWQGPPPQADLANNSSYLAYTPGVYTLTAIDLNNGCTSQTVATVADSRVYPVITGTNLAVLDCGADISGTKLVASVSTNSIDISWTTPPFAKTDLVPGKETLTLTTNSIGFYRLTVTTKSNSCASYINIQVIDGILNADFTADQTSGYAPLTVNFTNNSASSSTTSATSSITSVWSFGNGTTRTTTSNIPTSAIFNQAGTYSVTLFTAKGSCSDTLVKIIKVDMPSKLEVPNVFTPNGDNSNDIFFVKTANLSEISALIYDRWGNKIYELTTDKGNIAWDGKTQTGKEAPDGTYFYIITAKGKDGQDYNKKGTLSLFR